MGSQENLLEKQAIVKEIKEKLEKAQSAVIIDYMGINVAQATSMRKKLRDANVDYAVYKNTFMSRAVKGTEFEELDSLLKGPSALAISYDDAVVPAKILNEVMKEFKKMAFKGGVIEGHFYDNEGVKMIAGLPGREELIAKFMGSVQAPLSKLVRTFQAIADAKEA